MLKNTLLTLSNVHKTFEFSGTKVNVLNGVDLTIHAGDYISIMGPSGCGKSTLMHIIGCMDTPTIGDVIFDGEHVQSLSDEALSAIRRDKIGFVFQSFNLINSMSVVENVMLPMMYRGIDYDQQDYIAKKWLKKVKMGHRLHHKPHQLSGGEKQRVAIARSFVNEPKLILADEPTGSLDSKVEQEILTLFADLQYEFKTTIVMVTHSPKVGSMTKKWIQMLDGKISEKN